MSIFDDVVLDALPSAPCPNHRDVVVRVVVYWKSDRPVQVRGLMSKKDAYELDQVCLMVDAEFVEHPEF